LPKSLAKNWQNTAKNGEKSAKNRRKLGEKIGNKLAKNYRFRLKTQPVFSKMYHNFGFQPKNRKTSKKIIIIDPWKNLSRGGEIAITEYRPKCI
jgi:hypothetical protein